MIDIIAVIISGISLIIVIINQFKMIKDKEPQLSFKLISYNNFIYLQVINTGYTKANNIKINIEQIHNNGSFGVQEDYIFQIPFELGPSESIQGIVAVLGESIVEHVFPYIDIDVLYYKPHIFKKVHYKRKVYYFSSVSERINVETGINIKQIEHDINNIHKSTLRLANYFDGCEIYPFDDLNIISDNHFSKDLNNVIKGGESKILSRNDCIENRIRRNKSK